MKTQGRQLTRRSFAVAVALGLAMLPGTGAAHAEDDPWPSLQRDIFGGRTIVESSEMLAIDAPERAEDAAVVPITVRMPASVDGPLKSMWLIIDKNPAPVAVALTFGPAAGQSSRELRFSTRVRIDSYSFVHAVIETARGELLMTKVFVKASGGCSAPAPKDADKASDDIGRTLIKDLASAASAPLREAQVMIKHPNNNGMQMDVDSKGYIPARFIREVSVTRGADLVFKAETGFSISTNPNFRFTYEGGSNNSLTVTSVDTDGATFTAQSQPVAATQ